MNKVVQLRLTNNNNKQEEKIERIFNLKIGKISPSNRFMLSIPFKALSPLIDMRNKMPPIHDQGNLGSCTASALSCIIEYNLPKLKLNSSRLFLYYNIRARLNTVHFDSGGYIHDGVNSLINTGICTEKDWPYIIAKFAIKPPTFCYMKAKTCKVLAAQNINTDLNSMKNALASGYPFAVGIQVYSSFITLAVAKTGMVPMPQPTDTLLGGHAVTCVGYNDIKKVFIMRNSWGTFWGDKGYFYLPYNYLTTPSLTSDLWCLTRMI